MDSSNTLRKRFLTINTKKPNHETEKILEVNEEVISGEPVSPTGQIFHEPNFNCHIISIFGVGTPVDVGKFIEGIEVTLVKHPRFSSIQVLDESTGTEVLRWIPVKVNVKDHIIIPSLSADTSSNERQVEDYASSLSETSMDLSRPLWEFHILNIPTIESASTIIFRVHHSMGDGMSLISLLLACTRRSDDPTALPSIPQPPSQSGPIYARSRSGQEVVKKLCSRDLNII